MLLVKKAIGSAKIDIQADTAQTLLHLCKGHGRTCKAQVKAFETDCRPVVGSATRFSHRRMCACAYKRLITRKNAYRDDLALKNMLVIFPEIPGD